MAIQVYGGPGSTNTERVLFTLAEKGQEARTIFVDMTRGEQKGAEHLARHPFGVVPVLEHDGFRLYESRAIMQYLDARFPDPPLTPTDLPARARMWQWLSVEQSYLIAHGGTIRRNLVYGRFIGLQPDPAAVDKAIGELGRTLDVYERALAGQEYLAGDRFSLADLSIMPELESYASLPQTAPLLSSRPHVQAWFERIRRRPAWQQILEQKRIAFAAFQKRVRDAGQ
jgi:glutathione S-transferase